MRRLVATAVGAVVLVATRSVVTALIEQVRELEARVAQLEVDNQPPPC